METIEQGNYKPKSHNKKEIFLLELPFKALNIDPEGVNIKSLRKQISKSISTIKLPKMSLKNGFSDIKLAKSVTPKLLYRKKTYRNNLGQTKVVFEAVEAAQTIQFQPEYFADFSYENKVKEEGFLKIFEDGLLGKRHLIDDKLQENIDLVNKEQINDDVVKKQKLKD